LYDASYVRFSFDKSDIEASTLLGSTCGVGDACATLSVGIFAFLPKTKSLQGGIPLEASFVGLPLISADALGSALPGSLFDKFPVQLNQAEQDLVAANSVDGR
jgi:hypothetical protein